ncbi:hypothetical protein ACNE9Y_31365 [Pseudomonas sp. NY11226]|uniref:hypothetical protein n=1 Tax=unclassified Pseudomonas TaxID=196821 RepID=UPI0031F621BC
MTIHTLLAEDIIKDISPTSEYELNRNKTKFTKLIAEQEKALAKLEAEERNLKSMAYDVLENPDELEKLKGQIQSKGLEIELVRNDVLAYDDVMSFIDNTLDKIVTKKNQEQLLKYLKQKGISTVEQLKSALSNNN